MNRNWNQKTVDLILDENTWLSDKPYIPIINFCVEELAQYGVDPTSPKTPLNFSIFKQFNPSESEYYRLLILINIYKACFKFYELRAVLFHPDRTFDKKVSEIAFKSAGQSASLLTYFLTKTLKETITEKDYESVASKVDSFQEARSKGGRNKAESEARGICREMARSLKAKNKHLNKPDLVIKIFAEMENDKAKFKLKRDIPSFDTMMKWLANLDEK